MGRTPALHPKARRPPLAGSAITREMEADGGVVRWRSENEAGDGYDSPNWQPVAEVAGRSQTCPTKLQTIDRPRWGRSATCHFPGPNEFWAAINHFTVEML